MEDYLSLIRLIAPHLVDPKVDHQRKKEYLAKLNLEFTNNLDQESQIRYELLYQIMFQQKQNSFRQNLILQDSPNVKIFGLQLIQMLETVR